MAVVSHKVLAHLVMCTLLVPGKALGTESEFAGIKHFHLFSMHSMFKGKNYHILESNTFINSLGLSTCWLANDIRVK